MSTYRDSSGNVRIGVIVSGIVSGIVALVFAVALIFIGVGSLHGAYARGQNLKNAHNHVKVIEQQIKQQDQQILVVEKQAEQRYQEAIGIKRAQDEINSTLTPLYIEHEAIQAQQAIAESGRNNTVIYVPSGTNGVPIVQVTDPAAMAGQETKPATGG